MDETRQQIVTLIRAGQKLEAIKVYREASGSDLATAKRFIEELQAALTQVEPASTADSRMQEPAADSADHTEFIELLREKQKIRAIKRYCERYGVGLKAGKDAIEHIEISAGLTTPRQGCLGVLLVALVIAASTTLLR